MPKFSVKVIAKMSLDFVVEAKNRMAAVEQMLESVDPAVLPAGKQTDEHRRKRKYIRAAFQYYCDCDGVDMLEVHGVEEADDDAATL
jgi:hypothetical protein